MSDKAFPETQSMQAEGLRDEVAGMQSPQLAMESHTAGGTPGDSSPSPNSNAENSRKSAIPKQRKQTQQPPAKRPSRSSKELLDPKNFKDEMVSWCLDNWLARAKVVYTNGDIDGTSLWSPNYGQGEYGGGFNVFDGFDRTWYVPTEDSSPLPESKKSVQEQLEKRNAAMQAVCTAETNTNFMTKVRSMLEQETRSMCQNEWDGNRNNPAKPTLDFFQMVKMVAKTRLLEGKVLLPEYYRVCIVELTSEGKFFSRQVGMPADIDLEGVRLRLDAWSPANDDQSRETFSAANKKLKSAMDHGTDVGKQKAACLLKEMEKPILDPLKEGGSWLYKLHAKENYTLPYGKGPGRLSSWPGLKDADSLNTLMEGAKRGKTVVLARQWKIKLRIIWPQINQLEQFIVPTTAGEPQLTDEQFEILDQLLAEQSSEQREEGNRLACVLNKMGKPTHSLEFATNGE